MSTLLANQAIEAALVAIMMAVAALIAAGANYLNTRSRMMEQGRQIADLQRQADHLAVVQQVHASVPLPAPGPTIVTVPAAPAPAPPVHYTPADG